MDSLNFKYCTFKDQEYSSTQRGMQFAGITSRFTVPGKDIFKTYRVQGPAYLRCMRSCKSGKETNANQENKKSSNAEHSKDNTQTSNNKINRIRYNRHSSSDLDGSPEGRKKNENNSPEKPSKKSDTTSKKGYYSPSTLMSRNSINSFIKEKESKLAKTGAQTKFLKGNSYSESPKESKPGIKMKDQDIHQMPCGESGKWKYIRMYQERARRREAREQRKKQKERGKSKGKGTKGRRKSKNRRKSGKKRKTGKKKSRSQRRSKKSKSRRKSPKSKTKHRRKSKR